jgi:hypothetical protein
MPHPVTEGAAISYYRVGGTISRTSRPKRPRKRRSVSNEPSSTLEGERNARHVSGVIDWRAFPHPSMKPLFLFTLILLIASLGSASTDVPIPPLKASSLPGSWVLNGSVRAVRFELNPNGTFDYRGYGSVSKGRWNVEGSKVRFRWTHVDSVSVDAQKVTGLYTVESGALRIGKFEYRKNSVK